MRLDLDLRHPILVRKLTDLILVRIVEWTVDVFLDREMESGDSLHGSICAIVHARQQLRSAEAGLGVSAGCKDRFITAKIKGQPLTRKGSSPAICILDCNLERLISFQIEL